MLTNISIALRWILSSAIKRQMQLHKIMGNNNDDKDSMCFFFSTVFCLPKGNLCAKFKFNMIRTWPGLSFFFFFNFDFHSIETLYKRGLCLSCNPNSVRVFPRSDFMNVEKRCLACRNISPSSQHRHSIRKSIYRNEQWFSFFFVIVNVFGW